MPAMDYSKVADLYDLYVQTDLDVPFFIDKARGCEKVLELTSGTGRLSVPLLQAGVPLSCLDSSPEMLAVLRRKLQEQGLNAPVYAMDLVDFSVPEKFDLAIIPFNSFSEITSSGDQVKALSAVRNHLCDPGRLICTLHNPAVRIKTIDGQLHSRGPYPLPGGEGTLFFSSLESYDPGAQLVKGAQFYELYSPEGVLVMKRFVELRFFLHTRKTFAALAQSAGFKTISLYGNYDCSPFHPEQSPFMIWILEK